MTDDTPTEVLPVQPPGPPTAEQQEALAARHQAEAEERQAAHRARQDLATRAAQQQQRNDRPTVRSLIQAQAPAIEKQLAGAINSGAFIRAALSVVMSNRDLQEAEPTTLLGAIMLAAQLRLEIGGGLGQFYLTPRRDHGQKVCVPIIGYQGYIELAYRSGRVDKVESLVVRQGDQFTYGANSERGRFFDWQPAAGGESREPLGVVAMAKIRGAEVNLWEFLTAEEVEARRPSNWQRTPWATNPTPMWRKTGVRGLAPYLPKSTDLGRALEADEQRVTHVGGDLVVTRADDDAADEQMQVSMGGEQ